MLRSVVLGIFRLLTRADYVIVLHNRERLLTWHFVESFRIEENVVCVLRNQVLGLVLEEKRAVIADWDLALGGLTQRRVLLV